MQFRAKVRFVDFPLAVFEGLLVSHRLLSNCFFMQSVEIADKGLFTAYIFSLSSDGNTFIKYVMIDLAVTAWHAAQSHSKTAAENELLKSVHNDLQNVYTI